MTPAESAAWRPEVTGWSDDILPWIDTVLPGLRAAPKIAEVGVYHGRSTLRWAEVLATSGRHDAKLYGVDSWAWRAEDLDATYANIAATEPAARRLVHIVRATSVRAARMFDDGELDLVFIDGNHTAPDVRNDRDAWLPKVRPGGILAGHDYGDPSWPDVRVAVDELFASGLVEGAAVHGTVWSARKVPSGMAREAGLRSELDFWDITLVTGGAWPEDLRERTDPYAELQPELCELLGASVPIGGTARILDVGAGPLTSVGKCWPGRKVEVVPVDPLADEYAVLLRRYGRRAPVPTVRGAGEALLAQFGPAAFDLAYARNALDHAEDPVACIAAMLAVVKPGGYVVLEHAVREATRQARVGLHQHDFYPEAGAFIIAGPRGRVNVSEALAARARTEVREQNEEWFRVTMRKGAA